MIMDNIEVYVVTRAGRRIEDTNYESKANADERARALRKCLKEWDDPDVEKVCIVKTNKPNRIR